MWSITAGTNLNFLEDDVSIVIAPILYHFELLLLQVLSKLSFDMICKPDENYLYVTKCQPYFSPEELNQNHQPVSPTSLLFHYLDGRSDDSRVDMKHFAKLLGSIMMNGLPLFGLDDYVHASDFVNNNLDNKTLSELSQSPLLSGQFGSFLNVRRCQIRLSPQNCWTNAFVRYMKKTSSIIKVTGKI